MSDQVPGELFVIRFHPNGVLGVEAGKQAVDGLAFRKHHVVYHCKGRDQLSSGGHGQDGGGRVVHDHHQRGGAGTRSSQPAAVFGEHRIEIAGDDLNAFAAFPKLP